TFDDFKEFERVIRSKLPDTPIVFTSLSPAPIRWSERQADKEFNELVKAYVEKAPNMKYVECYDLTITPDDKPREELFIEDKLHPNPQGYKLLAERIKA